MRKVIISSCIFFLMIAQISSAETNIGFGWQNGYSMIVDIDQISFQLIGNFSSSKPKDGDSSTTMSSAGYAAIQVLENEPAKLKLFGGIGTTLYSQKENEYLGEKKVDFMFRGGFMPEVMVSKNVGISGRVGIGININRGYEKEDYQSTSIYSFGDVGMHWYF